MPDPLTLISDPHSACRRPLTSFLANLARAAASLAFAPTCYACDRYLEPGARLLCRHCTSLLHNNLIPPPAPITLDLRLSSPSRPAVPPEHALLVKSLGPFRDLLRRLILDLKFHRRRVFIDLFASILAFTLLHDPRYDRIDTFIPVPLHWRRRRQRGYNQSELLAAALVRSFRRQGRHARLNRDLLRIMPTPPQARLPVSRRLDNVRHAFAVRPDLDLTDRHVCLIDDVMTTGSTLRVCAHALRPAQPAGLAAAVLALADPRTHVLSPDVADSHPPA